MAWTVNDELWETAPEHRKKFWREVTTATADAVMLPKGRDREQIFAKIQDRIIHEGLT